MQQIQSSCVQRIESDGGLNKTDDILCHMFVGIGVKRSQSNHHYLHNEGTGTRGLATLE